MIPPLFTTQGKLALMFYYPTHNILTRDLAAILTRDPGSHISCSGFSPGYEFLNPKTPSAVPNPDGGLVELVHCNTAL